MSDNKFQSTAERVVWEALSGQLPAGAEQLVGQRITVGSNEIEIDLLVLWPSVGVAVIEVKGGVVDVRNGEWHQSGGGWSGVLDPSPVEQAQRAKHEFLRWINERSSRPLGRIVHLVWLPFTTLPTDWDMPDAPRTMVLDSTDLAHAADRLAHAITTHSADRFSALTAAQAEHATKMLNQTHQAIANHRTMAAALESDSNELTREQERVISLLRFQNRAQIIGGAGSGKTHLALIKAHHLATEGKNVALLCYSRGLARHFQLLTAGWPAAERPAFVGLFHDLPVSWGAVTEDEFIGTQAEYYEEHLPAELHQLAAAQDTAALFDAIVVDEAQDFADAWWDGLKPCLRDPDGGVLYVFADQHQTVFDREGKAPITLNPFPLDDNLRNTATIAATFAPLTPVEQVPRLGAGDPVRFVQSTTDQAQDAADDVIDQLIDAGWETGDIALLTTGRRHPEQKSRIDFAGHDGYWDEFFAGDDVFYGHVLNFKGLERRVVVLAINGFQSPERARHLLYVGLSRPRSLLVVVGDIELVREVGGPEVARRLTGQ